jgi:GNAT superfamily N-acetyltransferase
MSLQILPLEEKWIPGAVALQRLCFPAPFPEDHLWQPHHLAGHLKLFPEGQFVAVKDEMVVASSSAILIAQAAWLAPKTWDEITGGLDLTGHSPKGNLLFGVDISVHPDYRGLGIARQLYQARFDLVRRLGLTSFVTLCRLPGFSSSGFQDPADYARQVEAGERSDPTMTPLLKMGMSLMVVAHNCMEDEESGNAGAKLVWTP